MQECESIAITEKNTEEKTTIHTEVCASVKLPETNGHDLLKEKLTVERNVTFTECIVGEVSRTPIMAKVLQEQTAQHL